MHKPTVLVTAASGKTGTPTTLQLLARGFPVRALVRRTDARSARLERAGAEVVVGSLEDWQDVVSSLRSVQRAYYCPPLEPGALRRAGLFATAAREARLEVVVTLSQWLVDPTHLSVHAREKWLSEQILGWIPGVDQVVVNPGWFADNYMAALEPIAQLGIMALPLGHGTNAPPSNEDIARVIVAVLSNPAPHVGKRYRPTGPRLLDPEEIAATFATVLGRHVRYQDAPMRLFLKAARGLGISDFVLSQLQVFLLDYQRNSFGLGAPTDVVAAVAGTQPEDFEQIVRRYVANSPLTRRRFGARATALWNVLKSLATAAPNLASIEERLALPVVKHARLAADSTFWLAAHAPKASQLPEAATAAVTRG